METGTIVMMAIILISVWGGFTALVVRGVRIDRRRDRREPGTVPRGGSDDEARSDDEGGDADG